MEDDEIKNEIQENNIITTDTSNNTNLNLLNNIDNNLNSDNKDKNLPLLSKIITSIEEKDYIKPPIYLNELATKKNYDEININIFSENIANLLVSIKELVCSIEEIFVKKDKHLLELINKYSTPYFNFFYSLLYTSKQITIANYLIRFKFSDNNKNIDEYNNCKKMIKFESDFKDIDDYINQLKYMYKTFDPINNEQLESLKNHIFELIEQEKKMINIFDDINFIPGLIPITICFNCFEMNVSDAQKSITEMVDSKYKKDHLIMLFINNFSKLNSLSYFVNNICYSFNFDDVLNQKENDSGIWKCIKQHYIKYAPFSREIIDKRLKVLFDFVTIGYASISKSKSNLNSTFKMYTSFGLYSTLFFFNRKKAITESKNFLMKPELNALLTLWNMLDNPLFYKFSKIALPSIKYNHTFFIKKTQKKINIKLIEELSQKTQNFNYFDEEESKIIHELFTNKNNDEGDEILEIKNKSKKGNDLPLIKEKLKENKTNEEYVKIKVYNYKKLKLNSKIINESDIQNNINIKNVNSIKENKKEEKKKTIMIHVHGGGFVAMSPTSHENYTLKWANKLKIPIFSIDYRLSPGVAFPKALDDVYQSYLWILNYSKIIFNIEFEDIILAGDSAGGNLIISLTYLLIMNKIKLPKALFLFYPALKIDINTIVPSYLNAITDQILEYKLLKFCIESYSGQHTDDGKLIIDTRNKFLSPLLMDNNILKYMPPIRIFGCSCDVLRDDSFYFMEKLINLNRDVFFYEFKYLTHGFLNCDFKIIFPECSLITDTIIQEIEKFVE